MILEVDSLHVAYGHVVALDGVSLNVGENERVAVIGPNGAGKSSLLRCISGLVPASSGDIRFEGKSIRKRPAYAITRMGIAHVPEGRGIVGTLTARENLLVNARGSRRAAAVQVDAVVDAFPGLASRLETAAGLLSGGEQQMLALARALIAQPQLLLIDEPSMGLAPAVVRQVLDSLQIAQNAGTSILLVEQNLALALEVADRMYVFVHGHVTAAGAPKDLDAHVLETYVT